MIFVKRILAMLVLIPLSVTSHALSLKDVHQQVSVVSWHVNALREHNKLAKSTATISVQVGKTPLHAYTKALELLEKIQKYQKEQNLSVVELPKLPVKKVRSKHLMAIVKIALTQMSAISGPLKLSIKPQAFDDKSKTASDLYSQLWLVSLSMDELVAPINLADVQRNADKIANGIKTIAKRLDKPIATGALVTVTGKQTVDVTIGLYKLLYKIAILQRKLKLKPLVVPNFPTGDILASHAYEAGGSVVADLARLTQKLKIRESEQVAGEFTGKTNVNADQLYAQIVQLNQSVDLLVK